MSLSIFVVYFEFCCGTMFPINPTAFCGNVGPSTFTVVSQVGGLWFLSKKV